MYSCIRLVNWAYSQPSQQRFPIYADGARQCHLQTRWFLHQKPRSQPFYIYPEFNKSGTGIRHLVLGRQSLCTNVLLLLSLLQRLPNPGYFSAACLGIDSVPQKAASQL